MEQYLEEKIPQLLSELLGLALLDSLQHLVRLLNEVWLQRLGGLFPIPGTALIAAQPSHDINQLSKQGPFIRGTVPLFSHHRATPVSALLCQARLTGLKNAPPCGTEVNAVAYRTRTFAARNPASSPFT